MSANPDPAAATGQVVCPVVIGRAAELAQIQAALEGAKRARRPDRPRRSRE